MKNKKILKYLLLLVVVGIWGKIIYDVIAHQKTPVATIQSPMTSTYLEPEKQEITDYRLIANYRDPFLGKIKDKTRSKTPIVKTKKKRQPVKKELPKTKRKWPSIQYNGKMKNKANEIATAFVKIQGSDALMAEGETRKEIKLLRIFTDSIWVEFDEEKRTIVNVE